MCLPSPLMGLDEVTDGGVYVCVFEWVLQRAAAGHIFPVLGPRGSPAPNLGTYFLTSGLWFQPTPPTTPDLFVLFFILPFVSTLNRHKESVHPLSHFLKHHWFKMLITKCRLISDVGNSW